MRKDDVYIHHNNRQVSQLNPVIINRQVSQLNPVIINSRHTLRTSNIRELEHHRVANNMAGRQNRASAENEAKQFFGAHTVFYRRNGQQGAGEPM